MKARKQRRKMYVLKIQTFWKRSEKHMKEIFSSSVLLSWKILFYASHLFQNLFACVGRFFVQSIFFFILFYLNHLFLVHSMPLWILEIFCVISLVMFLSCLLLCRLGLWRFLVVFNQKKYFWASLLWFWILHLFILSFLILTFIIN